MEALKLYNALALLTDTAKLVLSDIHNPSTLAANLDYLAQAIRAAHPQRLSAWIRQQLNQATGRPERPDPEEWRQIRK